MAIGDEPKEEAETPSEEGGPQITPPQVTEGAQAPEAEGKEFDYDAEIEKVRERFQVRMEEVNVWIKKIFGSADSRDDGRKDFKISAGQSISGLEKEQIPESTELAKMLQEKINEIDQERNKAQEALNKRRHLGRLSEIEKI